MFISITPKQTPSLETQFQSACSILEEKLLSLGVGTDDIVCSRVFFSDIQSQYSSFKEQELYTKYLSKGAISCIEQPPLDGAKINILVEVEPSSELRKVGGDNLWSIYNKGVRHIFHSVRLTPAEATGLTVKQQTVEIFRRHVQMLSAEGLSLQSNCMRTWIFVRDIDHNYQGVVAGRNKVFEQYGMTSQTHFIASTGIGGEGLNHEAAVCIDFYSVDSEDKEVKYLTALDYLNPTMDYGVAFERGTMVSASGDSRLLISGTASIDNEGKCLYPGYVEQQAERIFINIEQLLEDGGASLSDMEYMIVYLRDIADYPKIEAYIAANYPTVPVVISFARVCRPEWLIEVECSAKKEK